MMRVMFGDPSERSGGRDLVAEGSMFEADPVLAILRSVVQVQDRLSHEQSMARTYKDELFDLRRDFDALVVRCREAEGLVVGIAEVGANYPGIVNLVESLGPEYREALRASVDDRLGLGEVVKPGRAADIDPTISPKMLREEANRREVIHRAKDKAVEAMRPPPDGFRSAGSSEKPFA